MSNQQDSNQSDSPQSEPGDNNVANAQVKQLPRISKVWFIPIVAVLIGSWMVIQTRANLGPLITIYFETAEGIEVNKTKIKLREISIGTVVDLQLNDKFDGIKITARLEKNTDELLKIDSEFWVVKPRIGNGGISGLSTLLSGAYIELSPGVLIETKRDFVGLENPPVTALGTPGLYITLDSASQSALAIGDPVIFRGIQVGRIEYVHFNVDDRVVYYDTFIESPYDKLVTSNTRFWNISGIEFDLSADGIQVHVGSLETLLGGGVTFDVPENLPKGEVITERAFFTIYATKKDVLLKQFKNAQQFILLFSQSIRGLVPGAPVEYKGVRIGSVVRTDIDYPEMGNLLDKKTLIPVLIQVEPARMGLKDNPEEVAKVKTTVMEMITNGLHGFISSGSLLTGSKYIEIQYVSNTMVPAQLYGGYQVIPTAASELDNLLEKLDSILGTIDNLSLGTLIDNAGGAMGEVKVAMENFSKVFIQVEGILERPESKQVIASLNQTLLSFDQLAKDFSEGSQTHQDVQNMISAMENMVKELTPVLSQLNHQPNSLLFGGKRNDEVEPEGDNNE